MAQPLQDRSMTDAPTRGGHVRPVPAVSSVSPQLLGKLCDCGHGKRTHEHYRAGSDCSLCGCGKFHRPLLKRLFAGIG